eukprot:scaffold5683_cov156-Amphora_coffeaeformis.AAC.7
MLGTPDTTAWSASRARKMYPPSIREALPCSALGNSETTETKFVFYFCPMNKACSSVGRSPAIKCSAWLTSLCRTSKLFLTRPLELMLVDIALAHNLTNVRTIQ